MQMIFFIHMKIKIDCRISFILFHSTFFFVLGASLWRRAKSVKLIFHGILSERKKIMNYLMRCPTRNLFMGLFLLLLFFSIMVLMKVSIFSMKYKTASSSSSFNRDDNKRDREGAQKYYFYGNINYMHTTWKKKNGECTSALN